MARKKSSSSNKKNNTTTTKQNRNLIKQILGRWRTQRKAPVTLPSMPNLSIDRVPSRKTPILLNQQTGRKVNNRQTKPEKQSTFFMEVGEIETMEKNSHNQSIGQETGEVHKGQYKRLRRCLRFEREDLGTIVIRLTSTLLLNDDI